MATTGAAMVMFEVVGSFQAKRLLSDARAQMNIMNAIMLNGLSGIFQAVDQITEQIDGLVDATVPLAQEFAQARIQFDKFMGEAENLESVREDIKNIGLEFGFTADKALEAGAKMAQLKDVVGGEGAVTAATEVGIKFALIGDMETQDAMQKLINLQQQTNFMFSGMSQAQMDALDAETKANLVRENSMKVLTQLNTVENRSAATMQQITFIMNQFASQAHLTGESIADMAANAAVLVESGEEMGKAGRALRMIYARLGANTQDNNKILNQYGVSVKDAHGNLLPLSDIVQQLAAQFPNLTKAEQQNIAQLVAGNDHYVRFIKLVQGADRQQTLATQASLGLSDAQDEVNIKLEDQANQLKKLQAELKNTEAEMGTAFIPAQMKATKQQISFNKAITDLYLTGDKGVGAFVDDFKALANLDFSNFNIMDSLLGTVVKKGMDFAFAFQRVQKVMGPVVEAMINIKSLSVAIQTQQTILRAMQGEQLVNPQIYNQAAQFQALTTQSAKEEMAARSRIKNLEQTIGMIRADSRNLSKDKVTAMYMESSVAGRINELKSRQGELLTQIGGLETQILNAVKQGEAAQSNILNIIQARAAASELLSENELKVIRASITSRSQEAQIQAQKVEAMRNEHAIQLATVQQGNVKVQNAGNEVQLLQKLVELGFIEEQQMQHLVADKRRSLDIDATALTIAQQALETETMLGNTKNMTNEGALKTMVGRLVQNELLNISLMENFQAQDLLNNVEAEEIAILENLTNKKFIKNQLTDEEAMSMKILLDLVRQHNGLTDEQISNLFQMITAQTAYGVGQDKAMAKQMAMNQTMTKYSGILGGASAMITLFDDSQKGAKASMALMMPVMIMSTIQMMQMTNQMMNQATTATIGSVANKVYAFSFKSIAAGAAAAAKSVKAFIASTGIGIAIVVAITAATYLFTDGVESMSEGVVKFNGHLTDSLTLLTDLQNTGLEPALEDIPTLIQDAFTQAGINSDTINELGLEETQQAINIVKKEMDELKEKAGDGATVQERLFMMQLEAAEKYIGALQTQETLLIAQLVLQGELAEMQKKMSESAMDNATQAMDTFFDAYEDSFDDAKGTGVLNYLTGGASMGGYREDVATDDVLKTTAAIIAAFQAEEGLGTLNADQTEDLLEVLGNAGTNFSETYANAVASSGEYTTEFMDFLDKNFTDKEIEMLAVAIDDAGDFDSGAVMDYKNIVDDLGQQYNMTTEDAQFLVDTINSMGSDAGSGALTDIANELDHLGDSMAEFNNNREAMFFGLSQSGATGDFVKQVQNKGVENLIANTELIITNNFNGMVLDQMVDAVTDGVVENLINMGVVASGAVN